MLNESISQSFRVLYCIFRKVDHDGEPNIIGSNFDVSVIDVGVIKGLKESIFMLVAKMTALLIKDDIVDLAFSPHLLSVNRTLFAWFSWFELLNGNRFESLIDSV